MFRHATAAAAVMLASTSALAYEPFSYTYLEAGYFENRIEADIGLPNSKVKSDGWGVAASWQHRESGVFIRAHYLDGDVDRAFGQEVTGSGFSADYRQYGISVGGASRVNERTSVHAAAGYAYEEVDGRVPAAGRIDLDADIYSFGAGGRYWLAPVLEVNADLTYQHLRLGNGSDNDLTAAVGLRLQPVSMLSVGVGYARALDSGAERITADLRIQF